MKQIQKKWTKKWLDAKIFDATVDKSKKKFFGTFPYPYVNSYLHLGHFYSSMRLEALSRYKRMRGYNVLYAQSWHATGSPIVNAAKRVKENEPKQMSILKMQGFSPEQIKKFEDPVEWVKYFPKEAVNDFNDMGYSIDWRRQFTTTDLNPHYDKFIRWQFNTLKKKDYVIQGKFPVIWCPKENNPIGDHSRLEGEGETPKDFIWIKYRMKDSDLILMTGTTRPDAVLATTHIWIDPKGDYVVAKVNEEKWVVGRKAIQKIKDQFSKDVKIIRDIKPEEIIGKWCEAPLVDYDVYTVPAWFIDADVGSGIVYSALEDPVDLVEINHIQSDLDMLKEYNLDLEVVKKLKPISIIDVPGMSNNLGQDMIDKYKITSPKETKKVKDAKDELNKTVFRKGILKSNCGKYSGMTVPKSQEAIKKDLIKDNDAVMFYEMTGKVVCRCLAEGMVKMVEDQWFLAYDDKKWTKIAHECLDNMKLYPEKTRQQFNYVLDWLRNWACTREVGLGTKLPWDEKWLIESLSDSTIYMAFYTIFYKIKDMDPELFDDNFFDYVFLNEDVKVKCDKKLADELREEFNYWYPMDFRNTAKDLIQNHMSFSIFNHVAIFPKKHWPVSYGLNGHVMVDGDKMSKSKGNFITMRQSFIDYGADASRFTALSGGEGIDDANFDRELAKTMMLKLSGLLDFAKEYYNEGRDDKKTVDKWMDNKIDFIVKKTSEYYDETLFRSALQSSYFDMQNALKWYMRRCVNKPNKGTINKFIEVQAKLLSPIVPFVTEEIGEVIGQKGFMSITDWPQIKDVMDDRSEDIIRDTREDINSVLTLLKLKSPKKITLLVAHPWKYELYTILKAELQNSRDFKVLICAVMKNDSLKRYAKDITKIIQKVAKTGIDFVSNQDVEFTTINQSKEFFENEFKAKIEVIKAQDSKENKANQAVPGKVAILVE